MEFQTNYGFRTPLRENVMSDELITEQTGYMTTKEQVERLILAGERLNAYRHGMLDKMVDEDDEDYDDDQEPFSYEKDPVELQEAVIKRLRYRNGDQTPKVPPEGNQEPPQSLGEEKVVHPELEEKELTDET